MCSQRLGSKKNYFTINLITQKSGHTMFHFVFRSGLKENHGSKERKGSSQQQPHTCGSSSIYTKIILGIFLEIYTFQAFNTQDIFTYIIIYKVGRVCNRMPSFRNHVRRFIKLIGNYFDILFFPIIKIIIGYFEEFRS